jgi:hypothetical protein
MREKDRKEGAKEKRRKAGEMFRAIIGTGKHQHKTIPKKTLEEAKQAALLYLKLNHCPETTLVRYQHWSSMKWGIVR